MDYTNPNALVSTEWLAARLSDPGVRVLDATFFLPTIPRDPAAEFADRHIPGAAFFDIDRIADRTSGLPHMLPDAATFAREVGALGIGNDTFVVVYDQHGGPGAAARVWWTFRVFGHDRIAVLNGGLPKWLNEGQPVESGPAKARAAHRFAARLDAGLVRDRQAMLANLDSRREQVVDARSPGRFAGNEPEPRPSKKAGHIPGSVNLPFNALIDPERQFVIRPAAEIAAAARKAGLDLAKPIVASCGSGVSAAYLALGLYLIGHDRCAVYDGSWAEWGNRDDTPVER